MPRLSGLPQDIFQKACTLTRLLAYVHIHSTLSPLSLEVLRNQEHLRRVEIDILPASSPAHGLEPLSNLPHLEFLSVAVKHADPVEITLNQVRELALEGMWRPMQAFLASACLPVLHSLSIAATHDDPTTLSPHCTVFFRVLSHKYAHLTELRVKCQKASPRRSPWFHAVHGPAVITDTRTLAGTLREVIEPILSLHGLRDVSLEFGVFSFAYTASDILAFATSWPDIETFRLDFATVEQQRAPFTSLVHFACCCPHLRALHLPEMELARGALDSFAYPKKPHPLRELNVKQVVFPRRMDLSWEMIQFAQRVFPHADSPVSI